MKEIPGWPGYFATAEGSIVSTRSGDACRLQGWLKKGYEQVTLRVRINGRLHVRPQPVHRLVLIAYSEAAPCPELQVRHLNGNCLDNRLSNLAWGSAKDNAADAIRHGTLGPGMRARRRRLSEEQVRQIRTRYAQGEPSTALAKEFGVSAYYPSYLARGRCWAHIL